MKPILVTSALTIAIAALFAIGSSPLVFAASTNPTINVVANPSSSVVSRLVSVPVTLSFSPKTLILKSAGCPTGYYCGVSTLTVTNTGSKAIKFTGCQFFFKLSSKTTYTKGTCTLGGSILVPAHFSGQLKTTTTVPKTSAKGTYNATEDWTNAVDKSGTGNYNYVVP
ncbi:MAG: hypothetical protein ACHQ1H_06090 [Nitrososphaerales archaeon]